MKLKLPKMFYNLDELVELWDKYEITEDALLNMAAVGEAVLSVWFDGTVIALKNDGTRFKQTYCDIAKLPIEEARQYVVEEGISLKTLIGKDDEKFSVFQTNKYEGIFWRRDLCMLPEEVERLEDEFRLRFKPILNQSKSTGKIHPKTEQTLLKIIGALLHIHYNRQPFLLNGRPNAQRIEEDILSNVGEDFLEISGLREGTIRKKIPEAFDSVKEYVKR